MKFADDQNQKSVFKNQVGGLMSQFQLAEQPPASAFMT